MKMRTCRKSSPDSSPYLRMWPGFPALKFLVSILEDGKLTKFFVNQTLARVTKQLIDSHHKFLKVQA